MDAIKDLLKNRYVLMGLYLLGCFVVCKIIGLIFRAAGKKGRVGIKASFTKGLLQLGVIIFTLVQMAGLSDTIQKFGNTILMSSSLIVVVLGFIFQEGLSNIVHGFILAVFSPFDVGDQVLITVGGETISGFITSMTMRHTAIRSIIDNGEVIIPNSLLDKSTVKNLTNQDRVNKYPLTVSITYEQAQDPVILEKAKQIFMEEIIKNKRTIDTRTDKKEPVFIKVDLTESAVTLTSFINTNTAMENYYACSEIREALLARFKQAGIEFAYNHLQLTGSVEMTTAVKMPATPEEDSAFFGPGKIE